MNPWLQRDAEICVPATASIYVLILYAYREISGKGAGFNSLLVKCCQISLNKNETTEK